MPRKIVKSKLFIEDENAVETLAEVPELEREPWGPGAELKVVSRPVTRIDGKDKVTGRARYTFDVTRPGMTHARTLRSPFPHARIKRIDITKAKKVPGVLAVITHQNTPPIPWYYNTSRLFDSNLRYEGDEVACLAAETAAAAEEALGRIEVEYEELPFVLDSGKALEEGAPKIHSFGNLIPSRGKPVYERGDVGKGIAEADAVAEETFFTQVPVHNPLEAHGSVVEWKGDSLVVWDSTQAVFGVRDAVARSLKIEPEKVRVIKEHMGGGFGSKLEAGKYTVMAALLAREIGRPVKILLDRREMNLAVGNRPDSRQTLKIGAKKDGTLTAISLESRGTTGAYPSSAGCGVPATTMYRCANVRSEEKSVITNAGRCRPFRASGHVQGTFALDSILDDLAEKIGIDPLELRMKNIADRDQTSNLPYTSKRLEEAYRKGAEAIGWTRRRRAPGSDPGPVKSGIGMASQIWWGGGGPPANATIEMSRDGSVHLRAGTQDLGTGTYTFMAQVAAEVLEIPIDRIKVTLGDTELCPYCNLSGGSLTAPSVSPAVRDAAEGLKAKLISGAAAILKAPAEALTFDSGVISRKDGTSRKIPLAEVVAGLGGQTLSADGARNANPEGFAINSFGAQFAEVEVDTRTGRVKVLKIVAAHDAGRILNPLTAENQFQGGVMQGLGYALMEERVMDGATGKVLTTNLQSYKLPLIVHPTEIELIIVSDSDTRISSVGVKGIGEPPIIPTAGAIANAVYNAIGVRVKSLPITPDKVLDALSG